MHLLLSLVLAFQAVVRHPADPVRRPVVWDRNRPQPAVEDCDDLDAGAWRAIPATDVPERNAEDARSRGTRITGRTSDGGRYRGMWFDNSGMFRPLEARRDGDALVSKWGTPETEEGETTYRLTSDSRMEIVDRVKSKDGTWREFGRSVVTR